jgi:hypothetical protein
MDKSSVNAIPINNMLAITNLYIIKSTQHPTNKKPHECGA